jgi:DNA-binding NarL/FixJ family response regulator
MTTIAIVEANKAVRETVREWVVGAAGYRCLCTCATYKRGLTSIPKHKPDVVLMGIHLPGRATGITCTTQLKALLPNVKIIVLTVYKDQNNIIQAFKAGVCGYLLKPSRRTEILKAIKEVQCGGAPMTGEIARTLVESFQQPLPKQPETSLSARETEVLIHVAEGLGNKEIAKQLVISAETIRNHLRHIYRKLHVRCRAEAVMKCHQLLQWHKRAIACF